MKVVYLQPYVPEYRVPLFNEISRRLNANGDSLKVVSAKATGEQSLRGDAHSGAPWSIKVDSLTLNTKLGRFTYRKGLGDLLHDADVCVMELDAGNLNAWASLLGRHRTRLVLWGHGGTFAVPSRGWNERVRAFQAARASHVMTYSDAGRQRLVALGVPVAQVSTVGNSTDTVSLRQVLELRQQRPLSRSEVFPRLDLTDRRVACFIGGIDTDKKIQLLVAAAREASLLDPSFHLLVAGSGSLQGLVQANSCRDYISWTPGVDIIGLADLGAVAEAIWMPGRVGLVAIDAMAIGLPVMTTNYPYHAPEIEYLQRGKNLHILSDDPQTFARGALKFAGRWEPTKDTIPKIETVAESMLKVIYSQR